MTRFNKVPVNIVVLKSLYLAILQEAEKQDETVTSLFEKLALEFIQSPRPYVIDPKRRIDYHKNAYEEEFPIHRTSLSIDIDLASELEEVHQHMDYLRKPVEGQANISSIVTSIFYYYCISHQIPVDERFFDEEYIRERFMFIDALEALNKVAILLGHPPTQREYMEVYKEIQGPSLSTILNQYGTFNRAKQEAGLL